MAFFVVKLPELFISKNQSLRITAAEIVSYFICVPMMRRMANKVFNIRPWWLISISLCHLFLSRGNHSRDEWLSGFCAFRIIVMVSVRNENGFLI
jgi:hypothetical protein